MPSCCTSAIAVALFLWGLVLVPTPSAQSPSDLRITNLRLAFDDHQPRKIVPRRHKALQAFVDIGYTGSGMIEGCWVVDGRVFADLARYASGAGNLRMATPARPGLPTVENGLHIITLMVRSPAGSSPPASLSYFVTTDTKAIGLPIALDSPPDAARIDPAGQLFRWQTSPAVKTFLIEFIDDDPGRPVMSAFTADQQYTVPVAVAKYRFLPGKIYYWRVKGFSADQNLVSESLPRQFQTVEDQETTMETKR